MRGTCHIGAIDLDYLIARLKATIACHKAFWKHLKKKEMCLFLKKKEMCRFVPKELKKTETSWTTTHRRGVSEPPTIVMPREELESVFAFNIFIIFNIVNLHHLSFVQFHWYPTCVRTWQIWTIWHQREVAICNLWSKAISFRPWFLEALEQELSSMVKLPSPYPPSPNCWLDLRSQLVDVDWNCGTKSSLAHLPK